jgi:RHS repeat-associated protein
VEATFTSLPWGDAQTTASGTDLDAYHYATLDYDPETATDHAQFRQDNSAQGHFMSPDPYAGSYDMGNPQSMNRYVYAMNNPLSSIDPSGLDACAYQLTDENGNSWWLVESTGDSSAIDCSGDGYYIETDGIVNGIMVDPNGNYVGYGVMDEGLYFADGSPYSADQSITVNADGDSGVYTISSIYSPSTYVIGVGGGGGGAPNNDVPMAYDIFHCPSCVNTWTQANCVVSQPLASTAKDMATGAGGAAFIGGVNNGAGWGGFIEGAWGAVKEGTATAGAALWGYANVIGKTAWYTVMGCPTTP